MDNAVFVPFPHHVLSQICPGGMLGRRVAATLHCGGTDRHVPVIKGYYIIRHLK